jgi:hypothetical protein
MMIASANNIRYYSLARQALVEALLLSGIGRGDHVLIPELICKDVIASIHTAGAIPIFYAVDEFLNPINLEIDLPVAAIIAVNYFGFPQNLEIFQQACEKLGAVLIEDNAHGFLSSDSSNLSLGTRGDIGIVSIRKSLRIPDGAQLIVNSIELSKNIPNQLPYIHGPLGVRFNTQKLILSIQKRVHLPLLKWMRSLVRLFRLIMTGSHLPTSAPSAEYENIISSGPRDSSMEQISKLDVSNETKRRIRLYRSVSELVLHCNIRPIFDVLPPHCIPYGFAFYGNHEAAREVQSLVGKLGVEAIHWPDLPESVVATAPFHYRNLWVVNFL